MISIVGDIHGKMEVLKEHAITKKPNLIIQLGDFGYWPGHVSFRPLYEVTTPIWFIDGNHEDHVALKDFNRKNNICHIKRGTVLDLPTGERALFIGGAASIDRPFRTPGFDWFPEEVICEEDIKNLPDEQIDVVFSHTCPDCILKQVIKKRRGRDDFKDPSTTYLQAIMDKYSPPLWYFSHWHIGGVFSYGGTKFTCLDVNEIKDLHAD